MVQIKVYLLVHILIPQEVLVRTREIALLIVFGLVFWIVGTLYYERFGTLVFETTSRRYWLNFVLTPIVTSAVCVLILRWMEVPASLWASATLLIAIPGMLGEAVLLSHFSALMPRMQETSAGKYGAFLFATYALVLSIAEIVTLRPSPLQ
jgi:hypothetical protein